MTLKLACMAIWPDVCMAMSRSTLSHDNNMFVVAICHLLRNRLDALLPAATCLPQIVMTPDSNCESIAVTGFAVFRLIASTDRLTCN